MGVIIAWYHFWNQTRPVTYNRVPIRACQFFVDKYGKWYLSFCRSSTLGLGSLLLTFFFLRQRLLQQDCFVNFKRPLSSLLSKIFYCSCWKKKKEIVGHIVEIERSNVFDSNDIITIIPDKDNRRVCSFWLYTYR